MDSPPIALDSAHLAAAEPSAMDEETFHLLYAQTAHPLRAYLRRMLADNSLADDILQESYFRLLRAKLPPGMDARHRKNYLFRIATNLLRDEAARRKPEPLTDLQSPGKFADNFAEQHDMERVLGGLKPRERELLWLAYVERFSHEEIAGIVGAKTQSIRPMLARARSSLADMLRKGGLCARQMPEESL